MSLLACCLRYAFWTRDFFRGAPVRSQYRQIRRVQEDGASTGEALRQLLSFAVRHSKLYTGGGVYPNRVDLVPRGQ